MAFACKAAGAVNDSETEIRALRNAIEITESEPSIVAMLAEALAALPMEVRASTCPY